MKITLFTLLIFIGSVISIMLLIDILCFQLLPSVVYVVLTIILGSIGTVLLVCGKQDMSFVIVTIGKCDEYLKVQK